MKGPPTPAAALLHQGFQAQTTGDLGRAEAAYLQALRLHPEQADALQLLGLLASRRGDPVAAEDLMRRSLRARPGQPHVWNNLGNLLLETARGDEALACFDQALTLDARYVDAHYNRARALHGAARLREAAAAVQSALVLAPAPSPAMLQLQAQIEDESGDIDAALATLERALQIAPERAALVHNRATLLQRRHRYREALEDHESALGFGLNVADAHYNRGNTLQSLGRHEDALAAYGAALALDPCHRLALLDIARLRWRLGQTDFDVELRRAARDHADSPVGPALQGQLLLRAERFADAASAYREAIRRAPEAAALHDGLANCLVRLGEIDGGLAAHDRAVALAPNDVQARVNRATSLLIAARPDAAVVAAQEACELGPDNQNAWALLGLAWRATGNAREAWLNDYRWVRPVQLEPPPGFANMASFNAELAQELALMHLDRAAPVDQTLRHGTQTLGDIFDQGHPLVDALKARITQAVGRYIESLPADATHPFLRRRAAAWRYTDSWSSFLGDQGFHTNHVHPHGWISSAYYVQVPACCADPAQRQGWLQFGEPDFDIGLSDLVRMSVPPRQGQLVLFPSMFWHGTLAFRSAQRRLSIAFDVMPA